MFKDFKLKEYYIILNADHLEFSVGVKRFIEDYNAIVCDGIVIVTTNDSILYNKVFKWLLKKYYWRYHNSCFSHHVFEEQCDWLDIGENRVLSLVK